MKLSSNFRMRLVFSALVVFIFLASTYMSTELWFQPIFSLLFAAIIGLALWEYSLLAIAKGFQPLTKISIISSTAYVLAVFLQAKQEWAWILPEFTLAATLAVCFLYYFIKGQNPLVNLSLTFFGLIYLTVPLSCALSINFFFDGHPGQDGRWWFIYLLIVTKMTDTGAYFFGKQFGKRKFAPFISPKKTWEGAIGGLVIATCASVLVAWVARTYFAVPPLQLSLLGSIAMGATLSFVAQFGDLAESLLKRDAGIKDSNQLPGLGGALDIVDSLVFTAPLLYLYLRIAY